jgi:uncharacterized phage protein (TIGR02218 family)
MSQYASIISLPLNALLVNGTKCYASCWRITRTDGVIFRYTDHDKSIVLDGETFVPGSGGFSATAQERTPTLEPANMQAQGTITDEAITDQDIADGKFREAIVDLYTVDWRYPFLGAFRSYRYILTSTTHSAERWTGSMEGLSRKLMERLGFYFSKACRWARFGDADCGFDRDSTAASGTVITVVQDRLQFTTGLTVVDDFYSLGELTWTSGANNTTSHSVRTSLQTGGTINLQLETLRAIVPGDTFSITRGCAKTPEACIAYGNIANYGGQRYLPGDVILTALPKPK